MEGIKGEVAAAGPLVATGSPVIAQQIWMDFTSDSRRTLLPQMALAPFSSCPAAWAQGFPGGLLGLLAFHFACAES